MDNKIYKKDVIFSDYDGTIYINDEGIKENIEYINKFRKDGGKFIIVTGRAKKSVDKVILKNNISYDYLITNNGAVIYDNKNNLLYRELISKENCIKINNYLKKYNDIEIINFDEYGECEFKSQELVKIRVKTENEEIVDNLKNDLSQLFSNDVIINTDYPNKYYPFIHYVIVNMVSNRAGKDKAISKLLKMLNINKESVTSIGDGQNDISMIREYKGYATSSADEDVKIKAGRTVDSVADLIKLLKI